LGTFVIGGIHTLLWLPRAFEMRRELKNGHADAAPLGEFARKEGTDGQ